MELADLIPILLSIAAGILSAFLTSLQQRSQFKRDIEKMQKAHEIDLEAFREKQKYQRTVTLEEALQRYTRPILLAAIDLQDRLWHLTQKQTKKPGNNKKDYRILLNEDEDTQASRSWPMTKHHYMMTTLYLFGRYFALVELLRQKTQFVDFGSSDATREFDRCLKTVERALAESSLHDKKHFSRKVSYQHDLPIFQFQQAMIGQLLINEDGTDYINLVDFAKKYKNKELDTYPAYADLKSFIVRVSAKEKGDFVHARCCLFANRLVDLIFMLDMQGVEWGKIPSGQPLEGKIISWRRPDGKCPVDKVNIPYWKYKKDKTMPYEWLEPNAETR
jgi:hypothetical protein